MQRWAFNASRHSSLACAVAVPLQRVSLPFLQQKIQELITAPVRWGEEEREFSNELTQVCKLGKCSRGLGDQLKSYNIFMKTTEI